MEPLEEILEAWDFKSPDAAKAIAAIDRALAPYEISEREADLRKTRRLRRAARRSGGPR